MKIIYTSLIMGVFCLPVLAGSPTPAPALTPIPEASLAPLTADGAKVFFKEFLRAQASEVKALEHRNQFELKELKGAQDLKFREWKNHESQERHEFFKAHERGPDRRNYIQDFMSRRDNLMKDFATEKSKRSAELDAKISRLKAEQEKKLKAAKKLLDEGKRPDPSLWP